MPDCPKVPEPKPHGNWDSVSEPCASAVGRESARAFDQASVQSVAASAPKFLNFRSGSRLPVVVDRIKWKHSPTFDASPYLDPLLARAFAEPALLRRPSNEWPSLPPARVRCSKQELLKLGEVG